MSCAICLEFLPLPEKFTSSIGNPPITLTELFYQCTEAECDCGEGVCNECHDYLRKYHDAMQIVREIKRHFLEIMQYCNARQTELEYEQMIEMDTVEALDETEEYHHLEEEECNYIKSETGQNSEEARSEANDEDQMVDEEESDFPLACQDELSPRETFFSSSFNKSKRPKTVDGIVYPRKCEECEELLPSKYAYGVHFRKTHFKGFVCEICGKTLMTKQSLQTHQENHIDKKLICSDCGQSFNNKFKLQHHMAWHTGQKPFQCEVCSKRFVHSIGLYRHKRIHQEDTRCIPCEVCGFKFRTNSHLRRHMLTHTGAKQYPCHICGKVLSQSYNLKVHIMEHENPGSTKQRRLKCKRCTKSFRNDGKYYEHCMADDCEPAKK